MLQFFNSHVLTNIWSATAPLTGQGGLHSMVHDRIPIFVAGFITSTTCWMPLSLQNLMKWYLQGWGVTLVSILGKTGNNLRLWEWGVRVSPHLFSADYRTLTMLFIFYPNIILELASNKPAATWFSLLSIDLSWQKVIGLLIYMR